MFPYLKACETMWQNILYYHRASGTVGAEKSKILLDFRDRFMEKNS